MYCAVQKNSVPAGAGAVATSRTVFLLNIVELPIAGGGRGPGSGMTHGRQLTTCTVLQNDMYLNSCGKVHSVSGPHMRVILT